MAIVEKQEWDNKIGQITAKAWTDANFKKRLFSEPEAVLKEHGLDVAPGVKIKVVEDTDTVCHLALPPKPRNEELSEEDLAAVAGGATMQEAAPRRSCRTVQTGL